MFLKLEIYNGRIIIKSYFYKININAIVVSNTLRFVTDKKIKLYFVIL
jgi:hypothetical protein